MIYSYNKEELYYSYNIPITQEYDDVGTRDFTSNDIYRLTLWKVDRYPYVDDQIDQILHLINAVKNDKCLDKEKTKQILSIILSIKGVGLPMASTYLRFRNPHVYQIIDRRVFRYLYGDYQDLESAKTDKVELYLNYLVKLRETAEKDNVAFETADRIYYLLDKEQNGVISLKSKDQIKSHGTIF